MLITNYDYILNVLWVKTYKNKTITFHNKKSHKLSYIIKS